jgi:hypothetical protein
MPQKSKLLKSRDEWKNKAVKRAEACREYRKTQKRLQAQIAELKIKLNTSSETEEDKKNFCD